MANAAVDTGHGATITLSSTGASYNWTSIDPGETSMGKVEATKLATTAFKEFLPEDLSDPGEITVDFQFDNEATLPAPGVVETVTVTFPTATGQTTAATLAGTGFITRVKRPNLTTNTLQSGQLVIAFDGFTGPTFTAAS